MRPHPSAVQIENLLRELAPQVLGALLRRSGDFASAEDAVQEALITAATRWPETGVPDSPSGWLIQVASRRMTDRFRNERARRRREDLVAVRSQDELQARGADEDGLTDRDDTLVLLFMCCHPALTPASAIALTLRAVGGLTTAEIANAFLVPEATMAQRISRAKTRIKESGVPFRMPTAQEWPSGLRSVLHTLYLIFNEGYTSSIGPSLQRVELSQEAIRLARTVHALLPDHAEVAGLLALMLLTDARRPARTDDAGELIPLAEQDRSLWDRRAIEEGVALVTDALSQGAAGPYQLQAAIAAVHGEAETAEATDWPQILALYRVLEAVTDSPLVTLNRAIAEAMVHGPDLGLNVVEKLAESGRLKGNHRLEAVRAHLLEMVGETEAAIDHFRAAARRTTSTPEKNYLYTKAARLARCDQAAVPTSGSGR